MPAAAERPGREMDRYQTGTAAEPPQGHRQRTFGLEMLGSSACQAEGQPFSRKSSLGLTWSLETAHSAESPLAPARTHWFAQWSSTMAGQELVEQLGMPKG